jgi:hypothetical protein
MVDTLEPALELAHSLTAESTLEPIRLPGEVTPVGLVLRKGLSYEQWSDVMRQIGYVERACMWWLGDTLNYEEGKWGEKYLQAAEDSGYSYQTLRIAKWVASRFELFRRRNKLTFGHHQNVAALDPELADRLLEQAERKGLSVQELRQLAYRAGLALERSPQSEFEEAMQELHTSERIASIVIAPLIGNNYRALGTGENEWYTPKKYIEAARSVLEKIDCDPASTKAANKIVKAETYWTANDDGLTKRWQGNVFLNPPYSRELIAAFIDKLVDEIDAGHTKEAILLTNNNTECQWFRKAKAKAQLICFTDHRIEFQDTRGERRWPTQGQAFFYFGNHPEKFEEHFEQFGWFAWPGARKQP